MRSYGNARRSMVATIASIALLAGVLGVVAQPATADEAVAEPVAHAAGEGVSIQLTPSEASVSYEGLEVDPLSYNLYWLQAEQRGCQSCHESMVDLARSVHDDLGLDVVGILEEMTVTQCSYCHEADGPSAFANRIHAIHAAGSADAAADCRSCHDAEIDGATTLWDEVKFDKMAGFTDVSAEDLAATIMLEWDQELTVSADEFAAAVLDVPESASEVTDEDWTVSVSGAVGNAATYRLADLKLLGLPVTQMLCVQDASNPVGGGLVGQVEVVGIPLSSLMLLAHVNDDAQAFAFTAGGGLTSEPIALSALDDGANALLVYEIDGTPVSQIAGGSLYALVGGQSSGYGMAQVDGVTFLTERATGFEAGGNTPNVGELGTHEGQIIAAGEPYTFSGYAYAFDEPITGIEISMDRGQSWVRYDLADTDFNRWVNWRFTFTPEAGLDTAYVLSVRSIVGADTAGEPIDVFVNAKADGAAAAPVAEAEPEQVGEQPDAAEEEAAEEEAAEPAPSEG